MPHIDRTLPRHALAMLLLSGLAGTAEAQGPGGPLEATIAEIARLDSIWLNAYVTADVDAVRSIVADDFVGQIYTTIMGKDALLDRVAASTGVEAMLLDTLVVNVYDGIAVAHARRRSVTRVGGERIESPFVYTDVYVHRDGRWQCITGQSAPAPDG